MLGLRLHTPSQISKATTPLDQLAELIDNSTITLIAILGVRDYASIQLEGSRNIDIAESGNF